MASSGKKGKKNKGTVISLQSFLSNGDTPAGTTQVSKKVRNLDGDESDDGGNTMPLVYQLPTAPRANRIFDDDSIPHRPPFIAYINNLPFDANEEDIYDFFGSINLVSLRLPREDGETGRSRGFGYVEMENRDDLIHILSLPDPSIKGRRIRIELSNENDQNNRKGNRRFEGFGNSNENRDSGNWRRDSQNNGGGFGGGGGGGGGGAGGGGGYSGNYDRSFNRDRKPISEREENNTPGSWRTSTRAPSSDFSPPRRDRERDRDQANDRYKESRGRNNDRYEREDNPNAAPEEDRPKLNLKPRTLPLPEIVTKPESDAEKSEDVTEPTKPSGGAPAESVFGSAKPVDTATRELEIEERLAEARRQDKIRREEESVNEKMSDIQIDKNDNENANAAGSWRRTQDPSTTNDNKLSSGSQDEQRVEEDDDYNKLNEPLEGSDRSDNSKEKSNQNREGKTKEENKNKRETRNERPLPQYNPNQTGPVLQSSNKYSGLDDEASE